MAGCMAGSLAGRMAYVSNRLLVLVEWAQAATERIANLKSVNAKLDPGAYRCPFSPYPLISQSILQVFLRFIFHNDGK